MSTNENIETFLRERDFALDERNGYKLMLRRNPMKAWCGYVGIPPGHWLNGKGYDDKILVDPEFRSVLPNYRKPR